MPNSSVPQGPMFFENKDQKLIRILFPPNNFKLQILISVGDRFICPYCCKTFEKSNSLLGHFRTHNGHWLCDICGFTTSTYYQRLSHIQEKHGGKYLAC